MFYIVGEISGNPLKKICKLQDGNLECRLSGLLLDQKVPGMFLEGCWRPLLVVGRGLRFERGCSVGQSAGRFVSGC